MHNRKQQISNTADARPDPEVVPTAKRRRFSVVSAACSSADPVSPVACRGQNAS